MPTITPRTAVASEALSTLTLTATLPSDKQTGDYVVVYFNMRGTSAAQFTGPTGGWTTLVAPTFFADTNVHAVYGMFNPSSAPVATTSNQGKCSAVCQAFGNVNVSTPIDAAAVHAETAPYGTSLNAPGITTVTDGAMLVSGGSCDSSSVTMSTPSGMTLDARTNSSGNGHAISMAHELRATAGATGVRAWTYTPNSSLGIGAWSVALRPGSSVSLTGSISATGVFRKVAVKNPFTGSITATGVFTKLKVVERLFTASITTTGAFTKRIIKNAFTGSITATGVFAKLTKKILTGSVTAAGFLRKAFPRIFTGSITATGHIATNLAGRIFGQPGLAKIVVEKAAELRMRIRRG